MLLATVAAPAMANAAAAPGWVTDSGNAGAYTTSLSCPTVSFCAAVNWNGSAVTYNGQGWGAGTTLDPDKTTSEGTFGVPLTGVSCASASFCVAVDNAGDAFTYDGSAWSSPTSIDPGTQLNSVSCPTSTYCRAIDVSGQVFEYDAGDWASKSAVGRVYIACASPVAGSCWTEGGTPIGPYASETGAITCVATPFCMAASPGGAISTWAGGPSFDTPVQVTPSDSAHGFSGVSCASETLCVAIDGPNAVFYMYDGTNWTSTKYQNIYTLNAVSCVPGGICLAVDSTGDVVSYPTALPVMSGGAPVGRTTVGSIRTSGTTVRLRVSCAGPTTSSCVVSLTLTATETLRGTKVVAIGASKAGSSKLRHKTIVLGSVRVSVAGGKSSAARLSLNRAGKRLLAQHHTLAVRLTLTQQPSTKRTLVRTIRFKVKPKH